MVNDIVRAVPGEVIFGQRYIVDAETDAVLFRNIRIQAAIVLVGGKLRGVDGVVVRDVGDIGQRAAGRPAACASAAATGVRGARPTCILRPQASRQRRTKIDALARDRPAIYPLSKSGGHARGVGVESPNDSVAWEGEIFGGDTAGGRQGVERRRVEPLVSLQWRK